MVIAVLVGLARLQNTTKMLNKNCLDCGVKVSRLGTKRCRRCYAPYLSALIKGKPKKPGSIKHGEHAPNWKGGRTVNSGGYIAVLKTNHPKAQNGYVLEHRLVMEGHLGRYLFADEEIHHINGDKTDNRLENLKLFSNHSEHMKFEHLQRAGGSLSRF